jgi:hypothetical protein
MNESLIILIILLVLDVPLFLYLGSLIFGGWAGFYESIKWSLIPDFLSLLAGKLLKDMKNELKLSLFLSICLVILFLEMLFVVEFILD